MKNHDPELKEFAPLIAELKEMPVHQVSPDFERRLMACVRQQPTRPNEHFLQRHFLLKMAAAILLFLGVSYSFLHMGGNPAFDFALNETAQEVAYILNAQRTDGSWSSAASGQDTKYDEGITALAILALLSDGQQSVHSPAIQNALAYLGKAFGNTPLQTAKHPSTIFNHYLAAAAFQRAAEQSGGNLLWQSLSTQLTMHISKDSRSEAVVRYIKHHIAHPHDLNPRYLEIGGPVYETALALLAPPTVK